MERPLCSLLVIVNKEPVYRQLLNNLKTQQGVSYELIEIDNRENQYDSARAAFNAAARDAKGEYLVFLHPDVRFLDPLSLHDIMEQVKNLGTFGVAGIAGTPEWLERDQRVILSTILHGYKMYPAGRPVDVPTPIQTLDECMFIVQADWFAQSPFSDAPGWHLYCVEHCLQAIAAGRKNYVLPARVWHLSDGKSLDWKYIPQLEILIKKYKDMTPLINTTVGKWHTRGLGYRVFRRYFMTKQWFKAKLYG